MAVANLVCRGEEAFVCVNGPFSEMIVDMVRYHGGKPVEIRSGLGSAVTGAQVAEALDVRKDTAGRPLFVVHNETATGAVSPVQEIFRVCKDRGIITVLDAISSFGGIDIRVDEWKADYAIGYSSKAMGAVFGAQPVALSKDVWATAKRNEGKITSRYLNLNVWAKAIVEMGSWGHPHPSSMPTSAIVGLGKATELVLKEGLENRYRRHADVARFTRQGLEALGLPIFPDPKYTSNTVSVAAAAPEWEKELRELLVQRYAIMIGGGLGELSGKVVRIGHMGTTASMPAVSVTLAAMGEILGDIREPVSRAVVHPKR